MSRYQRMVRTFLVAALTVASGSVPAALPLDDGPDGMTCYFFAKAGALPWQRNGGDWLDANDNVYGDEAFAAERVATAPGKQRVTWDVTALVARWAKSELPGGAILLRALPRSGPGTVNFMSREHADADARPVLAIEWDDDARGNIAPEADSHLACSTHRSTGAEPVLQVGGQTNAVLGFPFRARPGRTVRRATLTLTSDKQYAQPPAIGVFQALVPGFRSSENVAGIASAYPGDRGLDKHPDVIYTYRFEAPTEFPLPASANEGRAETVSSDAGHGFQPLDGRALKVTIAAGANQGLNRHLKFRDRPGGEPDEAFFRYYLRLGDNWNPGVDGGKLPGFAGTYDRGGWGARKSDGINGWSARGSFFIQPNPSSRYAALRAIGSYVYHKRMADQYGEVWGWGLGPTGLLERNRWYSVEQRVRLNTPGQADGVLEAWIDGQLAFSRRDIEYRSVAELRIESVWLNVYHGGTKPAPQDMTLYIDNLVVARRYIGPMARGR